MITFCSSKHVSEDTKTKNTRKQNSAGSYPLISCSGEPAIDPLHYSSKHCDYMYVLLPAADSCDGSNHVQPQQRQSHNSSSLITPEHVQWLLTGILQACCRCWRQGCWRAIVSSGDEILNMEIMI